MRLPPIAITAVRAIPLVVLLTACDDVLSPAQTLPAPVADVTSVGLRLDTLVSGLLQPVYVTAAPGDRQRLFIVEKSGRIRVWTAATGVLAAPFLDLTGSVSTGSEQGLLGLAFHPGYASNGRLFVNYTNVDGDTRVVEYARSGANRANPLSARLLLAIDQPAANHNGGMMSFGPDGYLYIATGDGGGTHRANAQRMDTLLGKILRIDVDGAHPYEVPPDNPFVDDPGARSEIWHLGLRNPWRFTFDRGNGRMYIADVGQNTYEEVEFVAGSRGGLNFGWPTMEGPDCFMAAICNRQGLRAPQHWYTHDSGCSITGGYVYRGAAMPDLRGTYFFADFCSGVIQSFRPLASSVTELRDWTSDLGVLVHISSFGEDARGELYVTTTQGSLFRIAPAL